MADFDEDTEYEVLETRGSTIIRYDLFKQEVCDSAKDSDFKETFKSKKCKLGKVSIWSSNVIKLLDFPEKYETKEKGPCPHERDGCFHRQDVHKIIHVAMGNFKGRIELEHVRTQYKTIDVTPLVVMAAPPYKQGISQNIDDTSTTFGKSKSSSRSTTESYGFSVEASVRAGFNMEVNALFLKTAEFESSISVFGGGGTDFSKGETHAVITERTYDSGSQDSVIFLWAYGIQSTYKVKKHPDPANIGKEVFYWKPLEAEEFKVQVDYFDENFPQYNIRSLLKHKVGDPTTYMRKTDPNFPKDNPETVDDGVFMTPMSTVSQGTGTQSISITLSEEFTDETSWNAYVGVGASARIQKAVVFVETEVSAQANFAGSTTTAHGKDLIYSATVGAIEDKWEFENYNYKYGLVVYTDKLKHLTSKEELTVEVINYYVDIPPTYGRITNPRAAQGTAAATGVVATGSAVAGKKEKCC